MHIDAMWFWADMCQAVAREVARSAQGIRWRTSTLLVYFGVIMVVRMAHAGAIEAWTRRYSAPSGDAKPKGVTTIAGNIYVGGYEWGLASLSDYVTIAYASDGVALWTNRFNSSY